jgi:hypothetical protein
MEIGEAILEVATKVTKRWFKQREIESRNAERRLRRMSALAHKEAKAAKMTFKSAAEQVMEEVYRKASAGAGFAWARQMMYKARPRIQELVGDVMSDGYFLNDLMPGFISSHPEITAGWDVVFEARGNFIEPHTGHSVPLGTIPTRDYLANLARSAPANKDAKPSAHVKLSFHYPQTYRTGGPGYLYGGLLFVEKEGFMAVFEKLKLRERYDLATVSPKGLSNTAARKLIDAICGGYKLPLYVLHDFDVFGFRIYGTLTRNTKRYTWENHVDVIDLGLRLEDVRKYDLLSEECRCANTTRIRAGLEKNGATEEEIDFLCGGRRCELNAFDTKDLIDWIQTKLDEHGAKKLIPDKETLELAYRRDWKQGALKEKLEEEQRRLQEEWEAKVAEYAKEDDQLKVPKALSKKVEQLLKRIPQLSWEGAVSWIADGCRKEKEKKEPSGEAKP